MLCGVADCRFPVLGRAIGVQARLEAGMLPWRAYELNRYSNKATYLGLSQIYKAIHLVFTSYGKVCTYTCIAIYPGSKASTISQISEPGSH